MRVILEGVDGSGKSSVAKIFKQLGYATYHFSYPPKELGLMRQRLYVKDSYYETTYALWYVDNVILDRFHLGEKIYGKVIRGYETEYLRDLEEDLPPDTVLVVFTASDETLKKRFDGEYITNDQLSIINKMYIDEFNESIIKNKLLVNTDEMSSQEIVELILNKYSKIKIHKREI